MFKTILGLGLSAVCFVSLSGFDSCSPPLLDNPGFDLWCADHLCAWKVEAGDIERVPTWHERDYGVALLGDPVILSQLVQIDQNDATCFVFDIVADADDRADLVLELDFLDDGMAEYVHPIPARHWQHVHYDLSAPAWYEGVRFRITKTGPGEAKLGQIRVERGEMGEECTAPGPEVPRADGVECERDDQCDSGSCSLVEMNSSIVAWQAEGLVCGQCEADGDCPAGQACALVANQQAWMHRACTAAGTDALGEACASDAECASGICCAGGCSECCLDRQPCPDGAICTTLHPDRPEGVHFLMPGMCAPGDGSRVAGQTCLYDSDCQVGRCQGETLSVCDPDGRRCERPEDCPLYGFGATCVALGVLDGVCQ